MLRQLYVEFVHIKQATAAELFCTCLPVDMA